MTVVVSFGQPGGISSIHAPGLATVRVRENITIPGSTTATVAEGEVVVIANGETSMVAAAFGTNPDAATTAATSSSSAGVGIPAGSIGVPLVPKAGDKINVKVVT